MKRLTVSPPVSPPSERSVPSNEASTVNETTQLLHPSVTAEKERAQDALLLEENLHTRLDTNELAQPVENANNPDAIAVNPNQPDGAEVRIPTAQATDTPQGPVILNLFGHKVQIEPQDFAKIQTAVGAACGGCFTAAGIGTAVGLGPTSPLFGLAIFLAVGLLGLTILKTISGVRSLPPQ